MVRDVESYLRQLAAVAESARTASGAATIASALAEAQRVAAWGLRAAVELGRERGLSWQLSISARTVASHLTNIREKLDVRTRVEVALWVSRTRRHADLPRP